MNHTLGGCLIYYTFLCALLPGAVRGGGAEAVDISVRGLRINSSLMQGLLHCIM